MTEQQRIKANELQKQIVDLEDLLKNIKPEYYRIGTDSTSVSRESRCYIIAPTIANSGGYVRVDGSNDMRNKELEQFVINNSKEVMNIAWTLLKPKLESKLEALKKEYELL